MGGRAARRPLAGRTTLATFSAAALDRVEQRHTPTRVATDLQRVHLNLLDRSRTGAGTREVLLAAVPDPVPEAPAHRSRDR